MDRESFKLLMFVFAGAFIVMAITGFFFVESARQNGIAEGREIVYGELCEQANGTWLDDENRCVTIEEIQLPTLEDEK